tara:strand:- start:506 stop:946 length:441 start_codon:yes stop_codon:yes gene_type:complete
MKRFVFPPILEILEAREKKISGDISDAESIKEEARKMREDFEVQLNQAHDKANTVVKLAEEESRKIRDENLQETQAKCKQMLDEAEREIKRNQDKVLQEIRGHIAQLTIASTEKVLNKAISQEDKIRLAEESIEEVLAEIKIKKTS